MQFFLPKKPSNINPCNTFTQIIFCIYLLIFYPLASLADKPITAKKIFAVIYFDDQIITNIDLDIAIKIASTTNPQIREIAKINTAEAKNIIAKKTAESIIDNMLKAKYINKSLTKADIKTLDQNSQAYCEEAINANKDLSFIKHGDIYHKYICNFLKTDFIWAAAIETSATKSVNISQKEIDIFVRSHPNVNKNDAQHYIATQKKDAIIAGLIEDVKNITYIKDISGSYSFQPSSI
jgi:hypothetical protein